MSLKIWSIAIGSCVTAAGLSYGALKLANHTPKPAATPVEIRSETPAPQMPVSEKVASKPQPFIPSNQVVQSAPAKLEDSAAVSPKKNKSMAAKILSAFRPMLNDPEHRAKMREQMKNAAQIQYADLFQKWGLDTASKSAVAEILGDRMMMGFDTFMLMTDEDVSDQDIWKAHEKAYNEIAEDLSKYISAAQVEDIRTFEKELPQRMMQTHVNNQLRSLNLDPEQQEKVARIVLNESKSSWEQNERTMGMGGMEGMKNSFAFSSMSPEQIQKTREAFQKGFQPEILEQGIVKRQEEDQRIFNQVQPLLTPPQFESFKAQRAAQTRMAQTMMKFMGSGLK